MAYLFFLFILVPLTGLLLITWAVTKNDFFGKITGYFWLGLIGFIILGTILRMLTDKKELDKKDYYGEYIINREYFPGKQTDWQYNNFRFEIKNNDSIYFHLTDKEQILTTYRGSITTTKPYSSERLIINMQKPTHHIMSSNPTTYRSAWSFYLVLNSTKFNNMYFKKGKWKPIKKYTKKRYPTA